MRRLALCLLFCASTALAAEPTEPALSEVSKLQIEVLRLSQLVAERDKTIADLRVALTKVQVETAMKVLEPGILKELGAKPGQAFDWATLSLKPAEKGSKP